MTYMSLRLLGDGTIDDAYRVDLPNYVLLQTDIGTVSALVSVSSRESPPSMPTPGSPLYPLQNGKYVLIGLTLQQLTDWYAQLDRKYPGRDQPFRPDFP